jgi:hypothetical protein
LGFWWWRWVYNAVQRVNHGLHPLLGNGIAGGALNTSLPSLVLP